MNHIHGIIALAALASALPSCASDAKSDSPARQDEIIPGFDPPPPAEGDTTIVAPVMRGIPASSDITYCTYIANPFGHEVDVVQSIGHQSKFGHHALLMEVPGTDAKPGDTHECTDKDMTTARFLAGGSDQAANIQIPEGITFRIPATSTIMIQTHWINTSDHPIDGATVFYIAAKTPDPSRQPAQLFTVLTTNLELPPRADAHATTECTVQQDLQFFDFGGHAHEYGKHVHVDRVRGGVTEALYDHDWQPEFQSDPPLLNFGLNAPLELHKGDVLRLSCDYHNTEDHPIGFPREMCVAFGFFFPAKADIQCANGEWIAP